MSARFPDPLPFEPLTDEQVDMLLIGTDDVMYELSRPTIVNALVLLAREVKSWRGGARDDRGAPRPLDGDA